MTVPDVSTLTEEQLQALQQEVESRLHGMRNQEQANREDLLNPAKITGQINALVAQAEQAQNIKRADIVADPVAVTLGLVRANRRLSANLARVLRVMGNHLESADIGGGDDPADPVGAVRP